MGIPYIFLPSILAWGTGHGQSVWPDREQVKKL